MALLTIPKETENSQRTNENKLNKNKVKKLKKKAKNLIKKQQNVGQSFGLDKRNQIKTIPVSQIQDDDVVIEYVPEDLKFNRYDPYYEFNKIFEKFKIETEAPKVDGQEANVGLEKSDTSKNDPIPIKARAFMTSGEEDDDEERNKDSLNDADGKPKYSKKKLKKMNRLSVAELKQLVNRPDIVEMHDVTSRDPKLLVSLKSTRNTVPVPRHWCFKRKYLQGKRGIEKPAFALPDFIQATGIMEMRQALAEKEEQKTLKSKMRERVRPKMGKIDIDYQKLHDAFFKWQTKPKMTNHGDLYYEGKEFEIQLKEKKPGNLSDELRTALGMPIGHGSDKYPPPWLIAMQRYGPPPSYPALKIAGLNAPIPEGTSFGYHAGGWGKPPVDELGRPLYGDVFGMSMGGGGEKIVEARREDANVDKSHWGELESDSEEESEDEVEGQEEPDVTGLITPGDAGLITPSGSTSVPVGIETPESIELRKRRIEDQMDQGSDTPANLYAVLPERKVGIQAGQVMGSTHVYDIATAASRKNAEGIEVTLNPEELDLDVAAMKAKYEQTLREQQNQIEKEDLSDMVAEHQARQQKKRKKQQQQEQNTKKKKVPTATLR